MQRKKILSILIKSVVGLGSVLIIYIRLKSDFTSDKLNLLYDHAFSSQGFFAFVACLLLIPVNWGIETYKWQLITRPVERITFGTATKSVYSGVCLGNLAPGRATEFLAKIIFFEIENRPKITVLHFVGGMFQLSITVIAGMIALIFMLADFGNEYKWMVYLTACIGILLLIALILSIYKIDFVLKYVTKKISKKTEAGDFSYRFSPALLLQMFGFSALRYMVFFLQFMLVISLFHPFPFSPRIFPAIALFFLITTTLPMISVLEAAIRTAIALVVFKGAGIHNSALALSSVLVWLMNIIVPSIFGYFILLRENFNFKLFKTKA